MQGSAGTAAQQVAMMLLQAAQNQQENLQSNLIDQQVGPSHQEMAIQTEEIQPDEPEQQNEEEDREDDGNQEQ